jgi:bifunctional N-acetylglucosamine-1-phosphate-uridyltransferase/glucosamine-1-phosphate-acetyltransferase GlmU-like protein
MIDNNNTQNEYYLTDIVKIIRQNTDYMVYTDIIDEYENKYISGVNTLEELLKLELFLI